MDIAGITRDANDREAILQHEEQCPDEDHA